MSEIRSERRRMPVDEVAAQMIQAALSRFPDRADRIREIFSRNEAFRDMCEELMEAEAALFRINATPVPNRERRDECRGWIDRLTAELGAALRDAEIARFAPRPRRA